MSKRVEIGDEKYDLQEYINLFNDGLEELVIVCSVRNSPRGISLCERIKRSVKVNSTIEMSNFLATGTDRRNSCKLIIKLSKSN
ncbi:hypothetical protein TpMuguga_03g02170 [Theileria parva strain Muguga]|uniref:uncharacterized protein n=1 Tax=Theileria parva strain Muguga TaxID=333668 RepID=UPI001C622CDE|nr:uncharacterized protein TpMuguga_03g02170 [Theileria parva strain Muguga]KAF5153142.1 hypothetical protein TpMuguga_03g02170 [Theileria parva strain Muguga]